MALDLKRLVTVTPKGSFKAIPEHTPFLLPNITPSSGEPVIGAQYPDTPIVESSISGYAISNTPCCATSKDDVWFLDFEFSSESEGSGISHKFPRFDFIDYIEDTQMLNTIALCHQNTNARYLLSREVIASLTSHEAGYIARSYIDNLAISANSTYVFISSKQNIVPFNKQTKQFEEPLINSSIYGPGPSVFDGVYPFSGGNWNTRSSESIYLQLDEEYTGPAFQARGGTSPQLYRIYLTPGDYSVRIVADATMPGTISLRISGINDGIERGFIDEPSDGMAVDKTWVFQVSNADIYQFDNQVSNYGTVSIKVERIVIQD